MKTVMIAALAAAQLPAAGASAQAAERQGEDLVAQQRGASAGGRLREDVELNLGDGQAAGPRVGSASASPAAAAQEEEPRKKRKSTGDKVLTGAAVVLGIGALAVGGLLVAIFVN
ncbi:MAG: hypothetical protein ACXW27_01845 [Allosphingosinicella sp.]